MRVEAHQTSVIEQVARLICTMQEGTYGDMIEVSLAVVEAGVKELVEWNDTDLFVLVRTDTQQVIGCALASEGREWFTTDRFYTERVLVVDQSLYAIHRARCVKHLLDALEGACKARRCQHLVIGTSSGIKTEGYTRLLARRGMKPFGVTMCKEL